MEALDGRETHSSAAGQPAGPGAATQHEYGSQHGTDTELSCRGAAPPPPGPDADANRARRRQMIVPPPHFARFERLVCHEALKFDATSLLENSNASLRNRTPAELAAARKTVRGKTQKPAADDDSDDAMPHPQFQVGSLVFDRDWENEGEEALGYLGRGSGQIVGVREEADTATVRWDAVRCGVKVGVVLYFTSHMA